MPRFFYWNESDSEKNSSEGREVELIGIKNKIT